MRLRFWSAGWWLAVLGLAVPVLAANLAHPGTLNYVEGQVSVDGKSVSSSSIGSADLQPGSTLSTGAGKAEVLLTPGVFLRVGSNSNLRLTSAGLADTQVVLDRGTALLEATEVHKENNIQIADAGLKTRIEKHGLYKFDADRSSVSVFDGKAEVWQGDQKVELKKGKQATAGDAPLKAVKFDRDGAKKTDELYRWSSLRSKYLAEASEATARRVVVTPGAWYGSGWYWNPGWRTWSWLPGDAYFSPFGYGFYSPWRTYAPVYVVPRYGVRHHVPGHAMRTNPMRSGPVRSRRR